MIIFLMIKQGTLSAALAKQFGVRKVVMISAVIFALMYAISAFSPSIILIIVFFGVIGGRFWFHLKITIMLNTPTY